MGFGAVKREQVIKNKVCVYRIAMKRKQIKGQLNSRFRFGGP